MKKVSLLLVIGLSAFLLSLSIARMSAYAGQDRPQVTEHKIVKDEIGKESACVVCGMKVQIAKNTPALDYNGKTYYFCSAGEKKAFSKDPEKYITQESADTLKLNYTEHKITNAELGKDATCPVSKRSFKISKDTPAIDYQGQTYYFCCPGCVGKFTTSRTSADSLKAQPDSLHHKSGGACKRKGCC